MSEKILKSSVFSNDIVEDAAKEIVLYHGSSVRVEKPIHGYGGEDNDYGSGFYTTRIYNKAAAWAISMGGNSAFVNEYNLDCSHLKVVNLDDYGVLAWIAEIASHRSIKSQLSGEFLPEFISKYKVNLDDADVIIGYRADDSYTDVIAAFCDGLLNAEEVQRLFYKGNLGEQYFIKSELAFDLLQFKSATPIEGCLFEQDMKLESIARRQVFDFLNQRRVAVAKRFNVPPITIVDAIADNYVYHKEWSCYEILQ